MDDIQDVSAWLIIAKQVDVMITFGPNETAKHLWNLTKALAMDPYRVTQTQVACVCVCERIYIYSALMMGTIPNPVSLLLLLDHISASEDCHFCRAVPPTTVYFHVHALLSLNLTRCVYSIH